MCKAKRERGELTFRAKDDFADMLRRASTAGVKNMIITGGSLRESQEAIKLAKEHGPFPRPLPIVRLMGSNRDVRDMWVPSYSILRIGEVSWWSGWLYQESR